MLQIIVPIVLNKYIALVLKLIFILGMKHKYTFLIKTYEQHDLPSFKKYTLTSCSESSTIGVSCVPIDT